VVVLLVHATDRSCRRLGLNLCEDFISCRRASRCLTTYFSRFKFFSSSLLNLINCIPSVSSPNKIKFSSCSNHLVHGFPNNTKLCVCLPLPPSSPIAFSLLSNQSIKEKYSKLLSIGSNIFHCSPLPLSPHFSLPKLRKC